MDTSEEDSKGSAGETLNLEMEFENSKQRLTEQRDTLKTFSKEGGRYVRLTLVLFGVPISILGALQPNSLASIGDVLISQNCVITLPSSYCLNAIIVTTFVGVTLFTSMISNLLGGGFEARGVRKSTNPVDIAKSIEKSEPRDAYLKSRLKSLRGRIIHNDQIIHISESLLVLGKFSLIISGYLLAILGYSIISETPIDGWLVILLFGIATLPAILLVYYVAPEYYLNSDRFFSFNPIYRKETWAENSEDTKMDE